MRLSGGPVNGTVNSRGVGTLEGPFFMVRCHMLDHIGGVVLLGPGNGTVNSGGAGTLEGP